MNLPVPQHGSRVGSAVQQLVNFVVHTIALIIGWQIDSIANVAGFATVDDLSIPDGSGKFVRTLKDTFHLDKTSTAVVDGITVVATMSGTGRWVRDLQPNAVWGSQSTWYVDPLTGDDENLGTTDITALATFAEARRRIEPIGVLVPMTIYIVSSLAADDLVEMNCGGNTLTIEGVPTVVQTYSVVGFSRNDGANEIGDLNAAWTVTDHLLQRVRFVDGPAAGMVAQILEDLGAGSARISAIIADVYGYGGTALPVPADTFVVEQMPGITFGTLSYGGLLNLGNVRNQADVTGTPPFVSATVYAQLKSVVGDISLTGEIATLTNCLIGFANISCIRAIVYSGAFRELQKLAGDLRLYLDVVIHDEVPSVYSGGLTMFDASTATVQLGSLWFYGALGADMLNMYPSCILNLGSNLLRGNSTSATLANMQAGSKLYYLSNAHTVVPHNALLTYAGVTVDINTQAPISDPHSETVVGSVASAGSGAIGSHTAGIKGAIGAATVFALPDFTSSATDDLPLVVTNRSFARNLRCRLGTAPGGADTVVVTVFLGPAGGPGVATAITLTFGAADTFKEDITHAVLVDPGEELSFEVVSSGAVAANLSISIEAG